MHHNTYHRISISPLLVALVLLAVAPPADLQGQRMQAQRSGISVWPDTTRPPPNNIFAPPPQARFNTAVAYIGLVSAFAAGSFAFSDTHPCDGCRLDDATFGSVIGSSVGAEVAESMLGCEHRNARAREALASVVAGGAALMLGRSDARTGEVVAMIGVPLTTAYFVAGCDKR